MDARAAYEAATSSRTAYVMCSPQGISFDFTSRKITIIDAAIVTKDGRIPITNQIITMPANSWGTVYYDLNTSTFVAQSHSLKQPNNYLRLFSWTNDADISGLDNYSINGQPRVLDTKTKMRIMDDFQGMFKSLVARTYTSYTTTYAAITYTDVYGWYDSLVTAFPGYVSRTVENTITTDLGVQEIRSYKFKPAQTRGGVDKLPKVIIVAGQHGWEKMGVLSTYNMMYDICNSWKQDDRLRFLRQNVEFIIFPCLNVWGINKNLRKNPNGVDLNRNYPTNWSSGSDPAAETYPGPSALSEIETQCVQNKVLANKDATLFVDFHNYNIPVEPNDCIWVSSPTLEAKLVATNFVRSISSFWKAQDGTVIQDDTVLGFVDGGGYGNGTCASNSFKEGIFAQTVEVGENYPAITGTSVYDVISQQKHEEVIVNLILLHLRQLCM